MNDKERIKTSEKNDAEKQPRKLSMKAQRDLKLKFLKADAETLKQSLTAYKSECATNPSHGDEGLYQLAAASGIRMEQDVLEHLIALLKLGVNPDRLVDVIQVAMKIEEDGEMVSVI